MWPGAGDCGYLLGPIVMLNYTTTDIIWLLRLIYSGMDFIGFQKRFSCKIVYIFKISFWTNLGFELGWTGLGLGLGGLGNKGLGPGLDNYFYYNFFLF